MQSCIRTSVLCFFLLIVVVINPADAHRPRMVLQNSQRQPERAVNRDDVITALGQFRDVESGLLKSISDGEPGARGTYLALLVALIGCDGNKMTQLPPQSAANALAATSWQHEEYMRYEDMRNSLIQEALSNVRASPPTTEQCQESFTLTQQLNIPQAALAVYGRRLQKATTL